MKRMIDVVAAVVLASAPAASKAAAEETRPVPVTCFDAPHVYYNIVKEGIARWRAGKK